LARRLRDSVVVITGASSGIGRATALRLAGRGSKLALAARAEGSLEEVREQCARVGAPPLALAIDVGDESQVERLAAQTEREYGRIDVWVNAAAVMSYGTFEQTPSEVFEKVLQTNLFGQSHGARAALRRFRRQGSGVLINVSSVWGRVKTPNVSAYVVSKHAIRALSECLRLELEDEPGIDVATILPQAVDTPIFEHAGNFSGRAVRPLPPLLEAEEIAEAIEMCAENPKPEVTFGRAGRGLEILHTFAPRAYRRIAVPMFSEGTFLSLEAEPSPGNVLEPSDPHQVSGNWKRDRRRLLRRGFVEALGGAVSGLLGRGSRS
jgi:NAD(P)-dependent dehydrogenase (short-subunit alcohol dehydrogenase family)